MSEEAGGGSAGSGRHLREGALAAVVVLLLLLTPHAGQEGPSSESVLVGTAAILLAVVQGVALLWRHTRPLPAAVAVLGGYAAFAVAEGLVTPFAAWVLVWALAVLRERGPELAVAATVATGVSILLIDLVGAGDGAVVPNITLTFAVALAALLRRNARDRLDAARDRAAADERLRLARDLHDLVGHGLGVVAVQAGAARVALDAGDSDAARTALSSVETTSRTAMREMRQMLGLLQEERSGAVGGPAPRAPLPGLGDLSALVANVRSAGVAVTLEEAADGADSVPAESQLCAYRVVQEALTNAVRHSPGSVVAVRTSCGGDGLSVRVESSGGAAAPATPDGGRGLPGLRARVEAAGGRFWAGATDGGWVVHADLPTREVVR